MRYKKVKYLIFCVEIFQINCGYIELKPITNINFTCFFFNVAIRKFYIAYMACIIFPVANSDVLRSYQTLDVSRMYGQQMDCIWSLKV